MIEFNLRLELIHDGSQQHEGYSSLGAYAIPALRPLPAAAPATEGSYRWSLFDRENALIASGGYDSLFAEWQTTLKPNDTMARRSFREVLVVPAVARAQLALERRQPDGSYKPVSVITLPESADKAFASKGVQVIPLWQGSEMPGKAANIVFVSEGYTHRQTEQFAEDARRACDVLMAAQPYASHRGQINVTGIFKPSRGSTIPSTERQDATDTAFDTSYGALGRDGYLAPRDPHALHEAIGATPFDVVIILCNSEQFGGSGLFGQFGCVPAQVEPGAFAYLLLNSLFHTLAETPDKQTWLQEDMPPQADSTAAVSVALLKLAGN